jgi:hypothetical protein
MPILRRKHIEAGIPRGAGENRGRRKDSCRRDRADTQGSVRPRAVQAETRAKAAIEKVCRDTAKAAEAQIKALSLVISADEQDVAGEALVILPQPARMPLASAGVDGKQAAGEFTEPPA